MLLPPFDGGGTIIVSATIGMVQFTHFVGYLSLFGDITQAVQYLLELARSVVLQCHSMQDLLGILHCICLVYHSGSMKFRKRAEVTGEGLGS
jgi:hypothetical protein